MYLSRGAHGRKRDEGHGNSQAEGDLAPRRQAFRRLTSQLEEIYCTHMDDEDRGPWRVLFVPVAIFSGWWVLGDVIETGIVPFWPMLFFGFAVAGIVRTYTD